MSKVREKEKLVLRSARNSINPVHGACMIILDEWEARLAEMRREDPFDLEEYSDNIELLEDAIRSLDEFRKSIDNLLLQ